MGTFKSVSLQQNEEIQLAKKKPFGKQAPCCLSPKPCSSSSVSLAYREHCMHLALPVPKAQLVSILTVPLSLCHPTQMKQAFVNDLPHYHGCKD